MKKNKVFVNKITDKIGNNQTSCEVENKKIESSEDVIEDKIEKLFNTNGYIFNINVKIVTSEKIYNTKIANRIGNILITLDNDVIRIEDIKDIVF